MPAPTPACAFVGADEDAARACTLLREAGLRAEVETGAGNAASGALGGSFPSTLGGSWLARVMVAAEDLDQATALLADFACGEEADVADFGVPLAAAEDRLPAEHRPLINDLVAELRALYGDRLQALKLVGSRGRGDARPDSDFDFLVFLDRNDYDVELPRLAELATTLQQRHACPELSISPMSREQFLGLDAKYEGITDRFRREAIALWP